MESMKISEQVLISNLTTMRLGGEARYVIDIERPEDVAEAFAFAKERDLPFFVLGNGANTIGRDEGFRGVIVRNKMLGLEAKENPDGSVSVRGMGGENWDDVVKFACDRGLSGIEAMSAIPSSLGAAPVQNIGAYGQDLAQVIEKVEAYDIREEKMVELGKSEMKMDYRKTIFNSGAEAGRYFIVAVTLRLKTGQLQPPFYRSLQNYIEEHKESDFSPANIRRMVSIVRAGKLPDPKSIASAGSFFKNIYLRDDEVDAERARGIEVWCNHEGNVVNSGWLIEQAGFKGELLHGIRVSEKAALVLINESAEKYADLAKAREEIRATVKEKFGYNLEQEPVEIA